MLARTILWQVEITYLRVGIILGKGIVYECPNIWLLVISLISRISLGSYRAGHLWGTGKTKYRKCMHLSAPTSFDCKHNFVELEVKGRSMP